MNEDSFSRQLLAAESVEERHHQKYLDGVNRLLVDQLPPVLRVTLLGVSTIVGISSAKLVLLALESDVSRWETATIIVALLGVVSAFVSISVLLLAIRGRFHRYRHGAFAALVSAAGLLVVGLLCLLGTHDSSPQIQNWIFRMGAAFVTAAFFIVAMTQLSRRRLLRRIRILEDAFRNETEEERDNED